MFCLKGIIKNIQYLQIRNFIQQRDRKRNYYDLLILPSQSPFLAEFISWFDSKFPSSISPIVNLLDTKAYLLSSESSLKSHLFCNYSLEAD